MINIALIAHDGKKVELVSFIVRNKDKLQSVKLFATGTTGQYIQEAGFEVTKLLSGPLGGDAQIAALVATKALNMIIFFRNPLDKHPHEPDVQMLMRLCDVHNIPLATNPAGAELFLKALGN